MTRKVQEKNIDSFKRHFNQPNLIEGKDANKGYTELIFERFRRLRGQPSLSISCGINNGFANQQLLQLYATVSIGPSLCSVSGE